MSIEGITNSKFINFDIDKISGFITDKLGEITQKYECRVLLVAERSSHVWGSSHPESDNDVKAVVYFRPRQYYTPIVQVRRQWKEVYGPRDNQKEQQKKKKASKQKEEKSECTDPEPDVELTCTEITKISQMILKNDPNVFEMFTSPIQYHCQCPELLRKFREIIFRSYDWGKLAQHYLSWAHGNYKQLERSSKKRMNKKPLKILLYVWRGILSAEWLQDHLQCKGLPLYIPDLIEYSKHLDDEEKGVLMSLLNNRVRKSQYEIDCEASRRMFARVPDVLKLVRDKVDKLQSEKQGNAIPKAMKASSGKLLEKLVYEIIESFE